MSNPLSNIIIVHAQKMEIDVIGIYLPPSGLTAARTGHRQGSVSSARLKDIENEAVRDIVERQIGCGLKAVTSGGIRWDYWDKDFFFGLYGIRKERLESGHIYSNEDALTDLLRFTGRISHNPSHPYFEDFSFMAGIVAGRAVCRHIIPSPAELYMQVFLMSDGHPERIYPDAGNLLSDITDAYRKTISRLYELGCRSIVLDDTICGRLCEDNFTKRLLQGGIDTVGLQDTVIRLLNGSLTGFPADLEKGVYLSGGDTVVPEWEYIKYPDNIMPRILSEVNADKFFMPFDTADDYSVEILRHVPEGKKIVLGLIDAHTPFPDDEETITRFVGKAERYINPAMLAVGSKTGFNLSSYAPRGLDYNDQWSKIESLASMIDNHNMATEESYV